VVVTPGAIDGTAVVVVTPGATGGTAVVVVTGAGVVVVAAGAVVVGPAAKGGGVRPMLAALQVEIQLSLRPLWAATTVQSARVIRRRRKKKPPGERIARRVPWWRVIELV
jgi:hypothetical protein